MFSKFLSHFSLVSDCFSTYQTRFCSCPKSQRLNKLWSTWNLNSIICCSVTWVIHLWRVYLSIDHHKKRACQWAYYIFWYSVSLRNVNNSTSSVSKDLICFNYMLNCLLISNTDAAWNNVVCVHKYIFF